MIGRQLRMILAAALSLSAACNSTPRETERYSGRVQTPVTAADASPANDASFDQEAGQAVDSGARPPDVVIDVDAARPLGPDGSVWVAEGAPPAPLAEVDAGTECRPVYPRKRTFEPALEMSAKCQERTSTFPCAVLD